MKINVREAGDNSVVEHLHCKQEVASSKPGTTPHAKRNPCSTARLDLWCHSKCAECNQEYLSTTTKYVTIGCCNHNNGGRLNYLKKNREAGEIVQR